MSKDCRIYTEKTKTLIRYLVNVHLCFCIYDKTRFSQEVALILKEAVYVHDINSFTIQYVRLFVLRLNVPVNIFSVMSGQSRRFLGIIKPQYTFTILATIHQRSSRFKLDGKIGVHQDVKKKNQYVGSRCSDSFTDPIRFIP